MNDCTRIGSNSAENPTGSTGPCTTRVSGDPESKPGRQAQQPQLIPQNHAAEKLAKRLKSKLIWDSTIGEWWIKQGHVWTRSPETTAADLIIRGLNEIRPKGFGQSFVTGVSFFLKTELRLKQWESARHLLPLANGVLDLKTRKCERYKASQNFNWQLPHKYNEKAQCPTIHTWLNTVTNENDALIKFLRAWMLAVLTGRYDLQKYLETIGPGGTGKSTFLQLCTHLVGEQNHVVTDLKNLEVNRFESANLYGKRLAQITDSHAYAGDVAILKAITGGDPLRNECKNRQAGQPFVYTGMVMIAANQPIQSSDYTSGLSRRRIPIEFTRRISDEERRKYDSPNGILDTMIPEIPGLLAWLLKADMNESIKLIQKPDDSVHKMRLEIELASNHIMQWMNEHLVTCPVGDESQIGKIPDDELFNYDQQWLYPNYLKWCRENGRKPIGLGRFSSTVIDIAVSHDMPTEKRRKEKGRCLTTFRIRKDKDDHTFQSLFLDI